MLIKKGQLSQFQLGVLKIYKVIKIASSDLRPGQASGIGKEQNQVKTINQTENQYELDRLIREQTIVEGVGAKVLTILYSGTE